MAQWFVVAVVLIVGVNCSRVKPPTKLLPMSKFAESVWQREGEAPVLAERRRAVFVPVRRDYGGARLKMEDRGFLPQLGEERVGPPYDSRPLLETELDDYDKLLSDKVVTLPCTQFTWFFCELILLLFFCTVLCVA
eukprot:c7582_g1_i2.p1 GENE.c7582_g1_i2~~c7582_g1_i2.p1  ORF type:complete len:136 (+),score=30.81 c7582_g1_i2:54-461(+)